MRVVLDTNVLVSALRTPRGTCDRVLRLALEGRLELVYSTAIMVEYLQVLSRPQLKVLPVEADAFLHWLEVDGLLVSPTALPALKDASDTKFLEAAVAAEASYLVTGNLKDFPARTFRGVRIVEPAGFLRSHGI